MIVEIYHRRISDAVAGTFSVDAATPETGAGWNASRLGDARGAGPLIFDIPWAGTFSADAGTPETGGGRNPLETADYQAQLAKSRATLEGLGQ